MNMGGAVVITVCFLIYLYKKNERSDELIRDMAEHQKAYQVHNKEIAVLFTEQIKEINEQFRMAMGQHFEVTRETIRAVGELRTAVSSLQTTVAALQHEIGARS